MDDERSEPGRRKSVGALGIFLQRLVYRFARLRNEAPPPVASGDGQYPVGDRYVFRPMNSSPLFRSQALAYASVRQYGSILLLRPAGLSWLTGLLVLIALAIVLFFSMATYTRKEQVSGVVMPSGGLIRVQALQAGVVLQVRVRDEQQVRVGDVLFVLANEAASSTKDSAEQQIVSLLHSRRDSLAEAQQSLLRPGVHQSDALRRRAMDLGGELQQIDEQILSQRRRVAQSEQASAHNREILEACTAEAVLQGSKGEQLEQRAKLAPAALRRRDTNGAESRDSRAMGCRDEAAAQLKVDSMEQDRIDNEVPKTILVRAPQAGVISGIITQRGQTVAIGQVLSNLSPAGSFVEAELHVPSRAAGFAKVGMPVQIRYRAYPFQKFGQFQGKVSEISRSPLGGEEWPGGAARPTEPLYRIRVALPQQDVSINGQTQPLVAGMMLDASLLLEKRKLYEWLLEPLNGIGGTV
jgi:membrane fusion protein